MVQQSFLVAFKKIGKDNSWWGEKLVDLNQVGQKLEGKKVGGEKMS
jgi:hypothetical protein